MNFDAKSGEFCLQDNCPIRLQRARGVRITSTAGIIWITVAGEPGDIFLKAGQTHRIASNGLAIVESIGAGRIRMTKPEGFGRLFQMAAKITRLFGFGKKTSFVRFNGFC